MNTVLLDAPTRPRTAHAALPTPAPGETLILMSVDTPYWVDPEQYGTKIVRSRTQFRVKTTERGRVVVSEHRAEMRTGPTGTGKTWTRWTTTSIVTVEALASGEWFVRRREIAKQTRGPIWTSGTYIPRQQEERYRNDGRQEITRGLHDYAAVFLPRAATLAEAYPLAAAYLREDDDQPTCLGPATFRRHFRGALDAQDLTRRLFGATRYRKDLVREVARAHLDDLCLAWQFRGLVPVDWIIDYLARARNAEDRRGPGPCATKTIRHHLRGLDQNSLRRLLRDESGFTANGRHQRNALAVWPAGPYGRIRSWEELHDRAYTYVLHLDPVTKKPAKPRRATLPEQALALNGATTEGRRIVVTGNEADLWEWGQAMDHCIGTYGRHLARGTSWLGAVFEGGKMVANFEIEVDRHRDKKPSGTLHQLLGKHNRTLDAAALRDVEAHLEARGVTVPGDYWGSDR